MSDLIGALKAFTVREIKLRKFPLPVMIELMDLSKVPSFEMVAVGPGELGFWSFEKEHFIPGTVAKKGPYNVRFTCKGMPPFIKEWPGIP